MCVFFFFGRGKGEGVLCFLVFFLVFYLVGFCVYLLGFGGLLGFGVCWVFGFRVFGFRVFGFTVFGFGGFWVQGFKGFKGVQGVSSGVKRVFFKWFLKVVLKVV